LDRQRCRSGPRPLLSRPGHWWPARRFRPRRDPHALERTEPGDRTDPEDPAALLPQAGPV